MAALARVSNTAYNVCMGTTAAVAEGSARYDQRISVVDAVRRAFEKFRHHREFTRRVKPFIEAELPGYTLSVTPDDGTLSSIRIWGCGLDYNKSCVYLCWNHSKPWVEGLTEALAREDVRDHEEREMDERALYPSLDAMEAQMAALRQQAASMIEALPIPKAATLRAASHFWDGPSSALEDRYPLLFGGSR